ncbi:MAG: type IX secretion system membrane protein PorP/SprF, partial [Flavobacteriaceae bacterium]
MKLRNTILLALVALLSVAVGRTQEDNPFLPYKVAPQNLLKFNRFLINPTFSTVREDKSYLNLLHRNQSALYKDNDQTYFLSYSGRISDRTGLGLSLYNQSIGPLSNTGALANLGYGVRLSENSVFSFGANLAYYVTGLNRNSVDVPDPNDFRILGAEDSNILSIQPGFNLALGSVDIGAYAENLFDYNFKTGQTLIDDFADKTYSGHLQYTHRFKNSSGLLEEARLMPLARVRLNDQRILRNDAEQNLTYGGSLILDLPRVGWLQGGYDSFYGASAGVGFNINRRLSLGYTMEKGFTTDFDNLGVTHELNFAYSFTPNLTEDRVMLEEDNELAQNENPFDEDAFVNNEEIEELKQKLAENDAIIQELMFRQDSLEDNRQKDLEKRFEMVMRMVRNETDGNRPDLENRAENLFFGNDNTSSGSSQSLATNTQRENNNIPVGTEREYRETVENESNTGTASYAASPTQKSGIKKRTFKNLDGVEDGYYLVANVYKNDQYLNSFIDKLDRKGIQAGYIDNPNNGLKYAYLERFDTWEEAKKAYESNADGLYDDAMWVMDVKTQTQY